MATRTEGQSHSIPGIGFQRLGLTSNLDATTGGILETTSISAFQTVLFSPSRSLGCGLGGWWRVLWQHPVGEGGAWAQPKQLQVYLLYVLSFKDSTASKRLQTTSPDPLLPSKEDINILLRRGFRTSPRIGSSRTSARTPL